MIKQILYNLFTATICISLYACNNNESQTTTNSVMAPPNAVASKTSIDTNIILKVGDRQFTVFEIQKNFKVFKQKFLQNNHREPNETDAKNWIKEFTERAYVLEDADKKGYYQRKDIHDIVENMAMFIIAQPHGLFEQTLTANIEKQFANNPAEAQKKRSALVNDYYAKIRQESSFEPDKPAIIWLQRIIDKYKTKNEIKKPDVAIALNKQLAKFRTPDGKIKVINVEDFTNFYNNLGLRRYLNDTSALISYLRQISTDAYLKRDAEKMGIVNDIEFKLNKRNFTNNVVYVKYMDDQLGKNRGVNDNDVMNIYSSVKGVMVHPTDITYSLLTFANAPAAYKALGKLQINPSDTTQNLNSLSQQRHIRFNKNTSRLPDTLKKMLYRSRPGQPLPPVQTDGYFTLLVIEKASGSEPFAANEIKPYLMARAKEVRELNYNHQKAGELSKMVKADNKINTKILKGNSLSTSI